MCGKRYQTTRILIKLLNFKYFPANAQSIWTEINVATSDGSKPKSSISISPTKNLALERATLTSNGQNSFPTKCVSGNYEVHTIDMRETEIDSIITKNGKLVVRK